MLPEAEDVDVQIDPNDLQIDVYRSGGPGGQSVNTTDSAVRITHKPSGIVVSMQDEKSQLQNREKAMRVLRARLYERALAEQQAARRRRARSQVGTGDRAEKIRTYNYGERRVTDHRIKLTAHNLDAVLEGELDEFTAALQDDEKRRGLEEQAGVVTSPFAGTGVREALDSALVALGRQGRDTRGSTPRCCSPTRSASTAPRCGWTPTARSTGDAARGSATRSGGAPSSASRSPTSSAARAFATSTWTSTRACWSRARRPSTSSRRCWSCRRARACSTSARAAARSRWRSRTSGPTCASARRTSVADALAVARANARAAAGSTSPSAQGDLLDGVDPTLDVVVSNPPYVAGRRSRVAGARGRRARAGAWRCSRAPTGSTIRAAA